MAQPLVLSVGSDPTVLDTRELILRSAGYIVVSALSVTEAAYFLQNGDFDLIILCHTFPTKDCERLTHFTRSSGSCVPIVCVLDTECCEHNVFADATVGKNPAEFLKNLEDVLCKQSRMPGNGVPVPDDSGEAASAKKPPTSEPNLSGMSEANRITEGS